MIQKFVDRFMARREELEKRFAAMPDGPSDYKQIVKEVVRVICDVDEYSTPDEGRIHEINDGDYQGTLLYVIGSNDYQPSTYWAVKVAYGSCSGCDTLESIRSYSDESPSADQLAQYMALALHIVQGLKEIGGEAAE
jgi:hypothetical protein